MMQRDPSVPTGAASRVLVVAELAVDAERIAAGLAELTEAEVVIQVGTEHLLERYLDVRPDVVVIDLLVEPDDLAPITAQLGAVGFDNEAVPFIAVVDGPDQALGALGSGAHDTVGRDEVATAALVARVGNAVRTRQLAVRLRRQRSGLADVVLSARQRGDRTLATAS